CALVMSEGDKEPSREGGTEMAVRTSQEKGRGRGRRKERRGKRGALVEGEEEHEEEEKEKEQKEEGRRVVGGEQLEAQKRYTLSRVFVESAVQPRLASALFLLHHSSLLLQGHASALAPTPSSELATAAFDQKATASPATATAFPAATAAAGVAAAGSGAAYAGSVAVPSVLLHAAPLLLAVLQYTQVAGTRMLRCVSPHPPASAFRRIVRVHLALLSALSLQSQSLLSLSTASPGGAAEVDAAQQVVASLLQATDAALKQFVLWASHGWVAVVFRTCRHELALQLEGGAGGGWGELGGEEKGGERGGERRGKRGDGRGDAGLQERGGGRGQSTHVKGSEYAQGDSQTEIVGGTAGLDGPIGLDAVAVLAEKLIHSCPSGHSLHFLAARSPLLASLLFKAITAYTHSHSHSLPHSLPHSPLHTLPHTTSIFSSLSGLYPSSDSSAFHVPSIPSLSPSLFPWLTPSPAPSISPASFFTICHHSLSALTTLAARSAIFPFRAGH
ncbi:unnamed protein product, partial [Closterium sp. NIES-54]